MDRAAGSGLAALQGRVERWRRSRPSAKSRIPDELWQDAVQVARIEGVYATAKALCFNYDDLKKRVVPTDANPEQQAPLAKYGPSEGTGGAFVRIDIATPQGPQRGGGLVIELTGPQGDRMRIDAQDASGLDVVGMVQAFWRRGL